ncbi:ferritin family protein [Trichloromonas sp.]|uniref:ferritin family protein n=1 Tax=Trichloromonas sp. TaxID=3069249 RepID=UPI003D81715D
MSSQGAVCYTFEAAVEMAVKMENDGFRHYLDAMRKVKNKQAKMILKDAALDELEHKHQLEKALVEGMLTGAESMSRPVPTMNLDYVLKAKEIKPDADAREALAYAIHLEKEAVEFYKKMASGCAGAPMGSIFEKIGNDETRHLKALEDLYEEHFMTEN